ncbi:MAG: DUF3999 family protein [Weeksellaceae bacterium]|nr:DUF3999 family protein [Weeksellaceae bacterium]
MTIRKISIICLFLHLSANALAQAQEYRYSREILGVEHTWHSLTLPPQVVEKTQPSMADLRVYAINAEQDTLEEPFILSRHKLIDKTQNVTFQQINTSHSPQGSYYTFHLTRPQLINHMQLQFREDNFDWQVQLQGSHDQQQWFTILQDYRIIAIKNPYTDLKFTQLNFPASNYPYYRLQVQTQEKNTLLSTAISRKDSAQQNWQEIKPLKILTRENTQQQSTEILLSLPYTIPVSALQLQADTGIDYYRPITVQYAIDSTQYAGGTQYSYATAGIGIFRSDNPEKIVWEPIRAKHLRILVHNDHNAPLPIHTARIYAPEQQLTIRFTPASRYFLAYGNPSSYLPQYDIVHFQDRIPTSLTPLTLGPETQITTPAPTADFFQKTWLWIVLPIITIMLLWYSYSLLRSTRNQQNNPPHTQ